MKHYGDITKISGYEVEIPHVLTGGSPCQDLSVAGKRAGLAGERSGLFMEQIRIVKELRENDRQTNKHLGLNVNPRYMVWENVTGALSSNNGEDFRAVLEETARVAQEGVSIPGLAKGQKWSYAGAICGDGWSIAWRVHDSQFHGVPQRRKRICVLTDFNGYSAADLLFECFRETATDGCYETIGYSGNESQLEVPSFVKSVYRHFAESESEGQGTSGNVGASPIGAISFQERAGKPGGGKGILIQNERTGSLISSNNQHVAYNMTPTIAIEGNGQRGSHNGDGYKQTDTMFTLNTVEHHAVAYCKKPETYQRTTGALCARDYKGVCSQYVSEGKLIIQKNRTP